MSISGLASKLGPKLQGRADTREVWGKAGNGPCDHPRVDREYCLASDTHDVCLDCDDGWSRNDAPPTPATKICSESLEPLAGTESDREVLLGAAHAHHLADVPRALDLLRRFVKGFREGSDGRSR
jgi:hypothetical protein